LLSPTTWTIHSAGDPQAVVPHWIIDCEAMHGSDFFSAAESAASAGTWVRKGRCANNFWCTFDASDRVAVGRCRPTAPTDPYVLALEHTVLGLAPFVAYWLRSVCPRRANPLVGRSDAQNPGQGCDQCYARNRQGRKSRRTKGNRHGAFARGTRPSGCPDTGSGSEPCRNGSGRGGTGRNECSAECCLPFLSVIG